MKQKELWDWGKIMRWVVLEMIQNPRGARGIGTGGRGDYVVSNSGTDCLSSHPMHNSNSVKGAQKYSRNTLDKMCSHGADRKVCGLLNPGCGVHEVSRTAPPPTTTISEGRCCYHMWWRLEINSISRSTSCLQGPPRVTKTVLYMDSKA